jgi:hypothetical protein
VAASGRHASNAGSLQHADSGNARGVGGAASGNGDGSESTSNGSPGSAGDGKMPPQPAKNPAPERAKSGATLSNGVVGGPRSLGLVSPAADIPLLRDTPLNIAASDLAELFKHLTILGVANAAGYEVAASGASEEPPAPPLQHRLTRIGTGSRARSSASQHGTGSGEAPLAGSPGGTKVPAGPRSGFAGLTATVVSLLQRRTSTPGMRRSVTGTPEGTMDGSVQPSAGRAEPPTPAARPPQPSGSSRHAADAAVAASGRSPLQPGLRASPSLDDVRPGAAGAAAAAVAAACAHALSGDVPGGAAGLAGERTTVDAVAAGGAARGSVEGGKVASEGESGGGGSGRDGGDPAAAAVAALPEGMTEQITANPVLEELLRLSADLAGEIDDNQLIVTDVVASGGFGTVRLDGSRGWPWPGGGGGQEEAYPDKTGWTALPACAHHRCTRACGTTFQWLLRL